MWRHQGYQYPDFEEADHRALGHQHERLGLPKEPHQQHAQEAPGRDPTSWWAHQVLNEQLLLKNKCSKLNRFFFIN